MSLCDGSRIQATDSRPLKYNEVYALSCLNCSVECSSRNSLKNRPKEHCDPGILDLSVVTILMQNPDCPWIILRYSEVLMVLLQKVSKWICPNMVHNGAYLKIQWYPMLRQTDKPKFTVFLLLGSSCTSFDGFRMVDVATQYALTGSNSAPLFRENSQWPVEARIKRIGWTVTRNQENQVLVHQPFMIV